MVYLLFVVEKDLHTHTMDPACAEMQVAIVELSERITEYWAWADEIQRQFRRLEARVSAIEKRDGGPTDDNLEQRLAAVRGSGV